jgi:hypothetical protein
MPVWGVWQQDSVWFSSSGDSRKTKNLATTPRAVIATDNALQPVVVEGDVERVTDPAAIEAFTGWVNVKYEVDYSVEFFADNACLRLQPLGAFGLTEGDFAGSPTRWVFSEG